MVTYRGWCQDGIGDAVKHRLVARVDLTVCLRRLWLGAGFPMVVRGGKVQSGTPVSYLVLCIPSAAGICGDSFRSRFFIVKGHASASPSSSGSTIFVVIMPRLAAPTIYSVEAGEAGIHDAFAKVLLQGSLPISILSMHQASFVLQLLSDSLGRDCDLQPITASGLFCVVSITTLAASLRLSVGPFEC